MQATSHLSKDQLLSIIMSETEIDSTLASIKINMINRSVHAKGLLKFGALSHEEVLNYEPIDRANACMINLVIPAQIMGGSIPPPL
jgi:hypothetical protein